MIDAYDNGQGMDIETLTKLQSSLMEEASFTELDAAINKASD